MLNSLEIKNFRSFKHLHVPQLGMVNLIVGKNNAGKSTVLEAVRIYAGNANRYLLDQIAETHDEVVRHRDVDPTSNDVTKPYEDLFLDRKFPTDDGVKITIGDPTIASTLLSIEHVFVDVVQETTADDSGQSETVTRRRVISKINLDGESETLRQAISVVKGEKSILTLLDSARVGYSLKDIHDTGKCGTVPTTFLSMNELARDWDKVALTEHEDVVKNAVRLLAPELDGITFVEGINRPFGARPNLGRVAKVKLSGNTKPIPLNSLGDGVLRVFQMTLRAFSGRDGFLLIDEFENGLHYSVQEEIWETIFELSKSLNMQVFATTHSWDCITSFAKVCQKKPHINGLLFRVGRSVLRSNAGQTISTVFDRKKLESIAQTDLEIR